MTILPTFPAPRRSRSRAVLLIAVAVIFAGGGAGAILASGAPAILALVPVALVVVVVGAVVTLTRFEFFLLFLLAIRAGIDSIQLTHSFSLNAAISLVFIPVALVWIAGDVRAGRRSTPTTLPSVLLVCAACVSVIGSADRAGTMVETLRVTSGLVMLELLQRFITTRAQLVRLLGALAISLIVPVAAGLQQFRNHQGVDIGGFIRIAGTLHHPNPYSIYLLLILLTLVAVFQHVDLDAKILLTLVIVPSALTLMLTYTRTAYIVFAVGIVVIGLLQSKKMLVMLAAFGVALVLLNPTVVARFSDLSSADTKASGATANSLVWRFEYWGETVKLAGSKPVTGIGLGMVRRTTAEQKQPHNDFVRAAAETGVLGLISYIWLLGALVLVARRSLRRAPHGLPRGVAVGFMAVVTATILASIVSNVLSQVVLLWYVAAITGAAVGATRLSGPAGRPDESDPATDDEAHLAGLRLAVEV